MLVGCTNCAVTMGRFVIQFYVSNMGKYNEVPKRGHIGAMIIIFEHLNYHTKLRILCDTIFLENYIEFDLEHNRAGIYPDTVEEIPINLPYPKS